jgi:hypothetical protein
MTDPTRPPEGWSEVPASTVTVPVAGIANVEDFAWFADGLQTIAGRLAEKRPGRAAICRVVGHAFGEFVFDLRRQEAAELDRELEPSPDTEKLIKYLDGEDDDGSG